MLKRWRPHSCAVSASASATSRLQSRIGCLKKPSRNYMKNQKWYLKLQLVGAGGCAIAVAACVLFSAVIAWTTNAPLLLLSSVQFSLALSASMSVVRSVLVIRGIHMCVYDRETLLGVESRVHQRLLCDLFCSGVICKCIRQELFPVSNHPWWSLL